jgi:predicted acyl esterase
MSPERSAVSASIQYRSLGDGASFFTAPFNEDTEFTGPLAARLWASSPTTDIDLFVTLRLFAPDGSEVVFAGASDTEPAARGWLRASHRRLDAAKSRPDRPYRLHQEIEKLEPGRAYALDVEIWPTSIVVPKGYRLALTVAGRDYEAPGVSGRLLHQHEKDRPREEFDALITLFSGPEHDSHLLLPFIPASKD